MKQRKRSLGRRRWRKICLVLSFALAGMIVMQVSTTPEEVSLQKTVNEIVAEVWKEHQNANAAAAAVLGNTTSAGDSASAEAGKLAPTTRMQFQENGEKPITMATTNNIIIDVVSIGSNLRLEYMAKQRATWAASSNRDSGGVRHFIQTTEDDDKDPKCQERMHARQHAIACRQKHNQRGTVLGLFRYMPGTWVAKKANPAGWVCAQVRPGSGLGKAERLYNAAKKKKPAAKSHDDDDDALLPDFLWMVDDDTYVDVKRFRALMKHVDSSVPLVWGSCLTVARSRASKNMMYRVGTYGGGGTVFSRGALRRMSIPLFCDSTKFNTTSANHESRPTTTSANNKEQQQQWLQRACQQLGKNLIGEQKAFENGMNMLQFINAFYNHHPNCFISDWPIGFFVDYYELAEPWHQFPYKNKNNPNSSSSSSSSTHQHTVRMRPLIPDSVTYYFDHSQQQQQQQQPVHGQDAAGLQDLSVIMVETNNTSDLCPYVSETKRPCPPGVLVCHYLTPQAMEELHVLSSRKQ